MSSTFEPSRRLFVITNDLKLYEFIQSTNTFAYLNIEFDEFPLVIIENNTLFFHKNDNTSILIEMNSIPVTVLNTCAVSSYEIYRNKLYFINKKLPYTLFSTISQDLYSLSNNYDFYNTHKFNSDYGKLLKILFFKNKLYVFQQYKILYCSALVSNYTYFNESVALNNKIIDNTIFHINDNIIFLTNAGLFRYDGNDLVKIFEDTTDKIVISDNIKAVAYENEYYIKCALKDNPSKNILIKFNIENEQIEIFSDYSINDIYELRLDDKYLLCINTNDSGNSNILVDKNEIPKSLKKLSFFKTNFDISSLKQIQNFKILGEGEFLIDIKSDIQSYEFKANANFLINNLNIKGNVFELSILTKDNFRIDSIILNILVIGE